jgi:transcriptional regulator with XRE-family HTH domain
MGDSPRETLAQYVTRIIKQKGLKLREVEERSGGQITNGYVSSIMNGNITNLTVEKIAALAVGLGVDGQELFVASYGQYEQAGDKVPRAAAPPDALFMLELMQKVVVNPTLMSMLQEAIQLSPDEQKAALKSVRRLAKKKSQPNKKSD